MPEIHLPLQHGQHEDIDAKMLPQGVLLEARNCRLRKDMRYSMRYGYASISGNRGQAVASGNFGPKRSVYFKARTGSATPATWFDRREDGAFSALNYGSSVGDLGVPRRTALVRNLKYNCLASDMVQVGSYIFGIYQDADYATGTVNGVTLLVHEAIGGRLIQRSTLQTTNGVNPKITKINNTVMAVWADAGTDNIKYFSIDATSLSSATGTIVTANAGRAFAFDIAPLDSTRMLLAYETSAVNLRWSTVTTAGVATAVVNQAIANPVRPSITLGSSGNVALVWAENAAFTAGNLHYRVDTVAGSSVVAKTTLDSSGFVVGFPVAGPNVTHDYTFAWNTGSSTTVFSKTYSNRTIGWMVPVSKPFTGPSNASLMWMASYSSGSQTDQFATYKLVDCESPEVFATGSVGGAVLCEAVACQRAAMPGSFQTTTATYQTYIDPRRFCVSTITTLSQPSTTAFAVLLPVAIAGGYGADVVRMDNGLYVDRLLPCNVNGQLLFTGPRVREFDGAILYESGLADGPEFVSLADGGAGGGTGGTVSVILTYEWQDAQGRRHRSPPSLPKTITVAGGNKITVSYSEPALSDRNGGNGADRGIYTMVWRTLNGGTIYYLDNPTARQSMPTYSGATRSYTIQSLDAAVAVNEVLYTQGERGGASGLLSNDEPPPCRFMWAGNDRVIMGGLEDPSEYRFSKLLFPGEPVQFTNDDAFKGHIDTEVTAVACLDGLWYVASRDAWFVVTGDGPDDMGAGFFAEPRRVSSVVGCVSHRSLVEIADGLLFLARDGQIWLLPRGGGAPVFFGAPIRDTLAGCFVMDAQYVRDENLVAWLIIDIAATLCAIIVYDMRAGEWMYDFDPGVGVWASPRATLDVYNGKLVIDGSIGETSAFTDDHTGSNGVSYSMVLQTGDIRPFGPNGNGRVRKVQALGEARSSGTITAQIFVSYDSGNDLYTNDSSSLFTLSTFAGNPVQLDHLLKYPRGNSPATSYSNSFRFKIVTKASSSTVGLEAFAFNALSLEVYPEQGLARQRAAVRV